MVIVGFLRIFFPSLPFSEVNVRLCKLPFHPFLFNSYFFFNFVLINLWVFSKSCSVMHKAWQQLMLLEVSKIQKKWNLGFPPPDIYCVYRGWSFSCKGKFKGRYQEKVPEKFLFSSHPLLSDSCRCDIVSCSHIAHQTYIFVFVHHSHLSQLDFKTHSSLGFILSWAWACRCHVSWVHW